MHNSGLFGEKYFPDLLSNEAVEYFIKCTHEEYYKRFKQYFGNIIKGIFTDEPSIGYCCDDVSIPYYDGLEEDYNRIFDRDFNKDMRSHYESFYLYATKVISDRFNKCYISKISDWCKIHGIIMTGHLMCDNEPFWTTRHNGRLLKNISSFMLPGIDEIDTDFTDRSEMALLGVAEYASGNNGAMAELFALGPCDMSYAKKRCMLYLAACHKINNYFLAISHIDMRGNMLVTDFFNNFSSDQPDFVGMKLLSEEAKKSSQYAEKDYEADVYIRYPFSVCAKNITAALDLSQFFNLINELTYNQIQWKFIDDERVCDNTPVIELNEKLEFTLNGASVSSNEIIKTLGGNITVTDINGEAPYGIFVRKFSDGSIIVLNLFAPASEYLINGKRIFINEHDVLLSCEQSSFKKEKISAVFDLSYRNPNMIRMMYLNSQTAAKINCECDMNVTFAIRKDTESYLNGQKINSYKEATALSAGMRELYGLSDNVELKKGVYEIKSERDFKYMPSVLAIGDFSAEAINSDICSVTLSTRKKHFTLGEMLCDYGKIEFSSDITIPKGAKAIEITGTKLYTCLYADDVLLGEKIAAPYVYNIDKTWQNEKIKLKIVQCSSIAPIFGNVDYWDEKSELSQWRGTPSPKRTLFGFKEINWIF